LDPTPQDVVNLPALKMLHFYDTIGDGAETLKWTTEKAKEIFGV
jgi:hypothetical protein